MTLVADDAELRVALRAAVQGVGPAAGLASRDAWPAAHNREAVQAEVRRRAALARGSSATGRLLSAGGGPALLPALAAVTAPVRRLHPLQLPPATAHRASGALVKRVVRRLTAWQLEPVVGRLNALQAATVEALERSAALGAGAPPAVGARPAAEPHPP